MANLTKISENQAVQPFLAKPHLTADDLARISRNRNTIRAYKTSLMGFLKFMAHSADLDLDDAREIMVGATSENVREWIAYMANLGMKVSTIKTYVSGLDSWFLSGGMKSPVKSIDVRDVLRGAARHLGSDQKKSALIPESVYVRMVKFLDGQSQQDNPRAFRDLAIFIIGYHCAMRRSEISALRHSDILFGADGKSATINIVRSKTDQEGVGRKIQIVDGKEIKAAKIIRDYHQWSLDRYGILFPALRTGFSFLVNNGSPTPMTGESIGTVISSRALDFGIVGATGHSLRASYVTNRIDAGDDRFDVMRVTGHKNPMVLDMYIRSVAKSKGV